MDCRKAEFKLVLVFLVLLMGICFAQADGEEGKRPDNSPEAREKVNKLFQKQYELTPAQQEEYRKVVIAVRTGNNAHALELLKAMKPQNYLNKMRRLYLLSVVSLMTKDYDGSREYSKELCELSKEPENVPAPAYKKQLFPRGLCEFLNSLPEEKNSENKGSKLLPQVDLKADFPLFFGPGVDKYCDKSMLMLLLLKGNQFVTQASSQYAKDSDIILDGAMNNMGYILQGEKTEDSPRFLVIRGADIHGETDIEAEPDSIEMGFFYATSKPFVERLEKVLALYEQEELVKNKWMGAEITDPVLDKGSLLSNILKRSGECGGPYKSLVWFEYRYFTNLRNLYRTIAPLHGSEADISARFIKARVELCKQFPFEDFFLGFHQYSTQYLMLLMRIDTLPPLSAAA